MVVLLKCQEGLLADDEDEKLKAFSLGLLCHLLEIYETDLTTDEKVDIDNFIKDWCSK